MFLDLRTESHHLRVMDTLELTNALARLKISKMDFARLIGVSTRAVNLWLSQERDVPGPVVAYLRLLTAVPPTVLAQELTQLTNEDPQMYDGMYSFDYRGKTGQGTGTLIFEAGTIYGHDGGVNYDGRYEPSATAHGHVNFSLRANVPPGVGLVTGVDPQPFGHYFDISGTVQLRTSSVQRIETPHGPVNVVFRYLRPLSKSAA